MLKFRNELFSVITLLGAMSLGACGDGVGVDTQATVRVLLTDAPVDYIGAALVDIGVVELIPAGDGPPITLSDDGTDGLVNLFDLQNGVTMFLAGAEVEAGSYTQLRLIVESARVVLKEPYVFNGGGNVQDLIVPSGAQTGIKLNLGSSDGEGRGGFIQITPGETVLVLDFDVSKSFVIQGNPETPAGINSVHFQPTLRVVVQDVAGTISGTVSTALTDVSVQSLTVTAAPIDEGTLEAFQTQTATTGTGADGTYTIEFLVPGTYTVSVTPPDGLATEPADVEVPVGSAEDVSEVDFGIVESGS